MLLSPNAAKMSNARPYAVSIGQDMVPDLSRRAVAEKRQPRSLLTKEVEKAKMADTEIATGGRSPILKLRSS